MNDFEKFQRQHARGIALMRLEKSPFIPMNPIQLGQLELSRLKAKIKELKRTRSSEKERETRASMSGWVSGSDAQKIEAWGLVEPVIPKVGELFGGRTMKYAGAAVHGGKRTIWSSGEWGAARNNETHPLSGQWPSQGEFAQEWNGKMGKISYSRSLPVPRNDFIDLQLDRVTWSGVGKIPYQERQLIHNMDRVAQIPKKFSKAYDQLEFSEEEKEKMMSSLGVELWDAIVKAAEE